MRFVVQIVANGGLLWVMFGLLGDIVLGVSFVGCLIKKNSSREKKLIKMERE